MFPVDGVTSSEDFQREIPLSSSKLNIQK